MQDEPTPTEILSAVAAFLRNVVSPEATALIAFQARVAANAVDLVARQIALSPISEEAELTSLRTMISRDGTLADLNTRLAEGIADGTLYGPDVAAHLWTTTLAKLAVDQPKYSGFRAALAKDI